MVHLEIQQFFCYYYGYCLSYSTLIPSTPIPSTQFTVMFNKWSWILFSRILFINLCNFNCPTILQNRIKNPISLLSLVIYYSCWVLYYSSRWEIYYNLIENFLQWFSCRKNDRKTVEQRFMLNYLKFQQYKLNKRIYPMICRYEL
jgi:hypothetical protein